MYIPGFVYNGREWHGWFLRRFIDFPVGTEPGVLTLDIKDDRATARFSPPHINHENLGANVAILGFDLSSKVSAGENRGRELPHDFIVLGITSTQIRPDQRGYEAEITIPETTVDAPQYAIVSWVSGDRGQAPLQATGGWLTQSNEWRRASSQR